MRDLPLQQCKSDFGGRLGDSAYLHMESELLMLPVKRESAVNGFVNELYRR